ncbi:benzoylformate decarboxylase [Halogranum amylolyticum]|uniref:Benzoylformate decarboxylase n=1 Tax=Halogranum amylolyticum TaxID=660520 RepID=A0A1H8V6I9_9EURY|nr:thiamine pyrophosphate-binding protein [Halogranum amylolyticum]SEP11092.1 benzoylformate decarboxylase [Halogranum amylolyticum]
MAENSTTGADLFVDALVEYGVRYVFGNPGTTELPILRSIGNSDLEYLLGVHEDIAVGMAAGYASIRRYHAHHDEDILPLGVVNLHVAPGLAHGLCNIQNADRSGVPLLVTAGEHATHAKHEEPILSGDLVQMVEEYTKWSAVVEDVTALPTMIRRAVRVALTPPMGPVFLGLPMDVMMAETDADPERLGPIPTLGSGDPTAIEASVRALETADDPVIVVGDHVARSGFRAVEAAVELAEETGAAVYGEMETAEINFPTDHNQWVTFLQPDPEMARIALDTDLLVFVGCSANVPVIPSETTYISDEASCIHISSDAWEVGKNNPADTAVIGDPEEAMAAIAAAVDIPEAERRRRQSGIPKRHKEMEPFCSDSDPDAGISKGQLSSTLAAVAPNAILTNEGNTSKYPLLNNWDLGPEQLSANKNGGLGYTLPATIGAAVAAREYGDERPIIGVVGDGSYLYYPQALYSAARYDLDLTVVVPDNRNYRILKDGMLSIYGGDDADHDYLGMDFDPGVDIVANAKSHGVHAEFVESADTLEAALREAVELDGSAVVDVAIKD